MGRENIFRKKRNYLKIITLKIALFCVISTLDAAQLKWQTPSTAQSGEKLKYSQQFEGRAKSADSVNVIDLGKIFIPPVNKKSTSRKMPGSPLSELNKLNQERIEILKTLKRLEEKMNKRKKRKKRPSRRPCV